MKYLSKFLHLSLIAVLWTWLFVKITNLLFIEVWNFNFTSTHSWNIVKGFWERGGNIKTTQDILLFVALILLPVFWFIGLRLALKINYINLLFLPFNLVSSLFGLGSKLPERAVIRPTKSTEQQIEEIKTEIASIKPQKNQNTSSIRSAIKEKLSNDL